MPKADLFMEELRSHTKNADRHAPDVSKWPIGMHIQHCCLAMNSICEAMGRSSPPAPQGRFSPVTSLIFLTGRIPRGRAQAPAGARPNPEIEPDQLETLLNESARQINQASQLGPNAWFKHFAFGPLRRDKALRFIRIHNRHHLKIITDITVASSSA